MALLSSPQRRPGAPHSPLAATPAFTRDGGDIAFVLGGEPVRALQAGGLFLSRHGVLIVSDLHLEKGSAFASRGQLLPPYDTRATLARLAGLCAQLKPAVVVSLGDSFHDGGAMQRMDAEDRAALEGLIGAHRWIWITGNHDPETPACLDGVRAEWVQFAALTLRHEPTPGAASGEIAGHLHPCARIAGDARSVRVRCFATDGQRLVMPAFGAYTGGLSLRDDAFTPVFPEGAVALAIGARQLYPIGPERQIG